LKRNKGDNRYIEEIDEMFRLKLYLKGRYLIYCTRHVIEKPSSGTLIVKRLESQNN